MSGFAARSEVVGTNGATSWRVALGDGRSVLLEFPASTIALRIRRNEDRVTVERTEDGDAWLPLDRSPAKPVRWASLEELTGEDPPR